MPVQPSLFEPVPDPTGASSTPTLDKRLVAARLQGLLRELSLLNEEIPVIVEGRRDVAALRRLGLNGTILTLHCGQTVAAFGERLARQFPAVILLLDWDRRGCQLHKQLTRQLDTDWEEYHYIRQELIALCKPAISSPAISSIEELPALLAPPLAPKPAQTAGRQPIP